MIRLGQRDRHYGEECWWWGGGNECEMVTGGYTSSSGRVEPKKAPTEVKKLIRRVVKKTLEEEKIIDKVDYTEKIIEELRKIQIESKIDHQYAFELYRKRVEEVKRRKRAIAFLLLT